MKSAIWKTLASVSILAITACSQPDDEWTEPDDGEEPELGTSLTGKEMQGKFVLGKSMDLIAGDDSTRHFSASRFNKGQEVKLIGAALQPSSGTLLASNEDELTFTYARTELGVSYYLLSRRDATTGRSSDPCAGTEAIPMLGTFTREGLREEDPDRLTFACRDGAALKCLEAGYKPGVNPNDRPTWMAFQACTQEFRADYCAKGVSHTREETVIELYDYVEVRGEPTPKDKFEGVEDWPPPPGQFYFEGAYLVDHQTVFCLSRIRWSSIPPNGPTECDLGDLPDPRTDPDGHFCEEYDWDRDGAPAGEDGSGEGGIKLTVDDEDILVLNASKFNDLPLLVWRNGSGPDNVSTVQGYNDDDYPEPPFPNGSWSFVSLDGFLLRSLTGGITQNDVYKVAIWKRGNADHVLGPINVTLPGWPLNNYSVPAAAPLEGWIFRNWRLGTVPLILYERPAGATTEYLSTAVPPPLASGYVQSAAGTLGYVMAPEL